MANYPCDPIPHLPPGYTIVELYDHQRHRGYHVFNGAPLLPFEEWGIVELIPATNPEQFASDATLIRGFLDTQGHHVHQITRSGMGTALVQFVDVATCDAVVARSPFFVGDSTLRVIKHNRGINHRNCTFTHDAWVMMMNYPLGHGDSWTVANYILHSDLIAGPGGDEDPLPPHGGNPHPFPAMPFGGIWNDEIFAGHDANQIIMNNIPIDEHNEEMAHMVHTPPQEPMAHAQQHDNIQPAVVAMDAFCALHELINHTMKNASMLMNQFEPNSVIAARIQILNVTDEMYSTMKGVMTIITEEKSTLTKNSCTITEIGEEQMFMDHIGDTYDQTPSTRLVSPADETEDMHPLENSVAHSMMDTTDDHWSDTMEDMTAEQPMENSVAITDNSIPVRNKKQKYTPKDVTEVRRSNRIAVIAARYKDKEAAMQAAAKEVDKSKSKEKHSVKAVSKKKIASKKAGKNQFSAVVRDQGAPPPPELPMDTIQAIGREQSQIPPEEISADKLLANV
ncbi:hypothetical protein ACQ4PT_014652 [Festuca glaucescens]